MTSDDVHTPVRYPSDLSDEEWAIIEQVLNELDPYKTGRRRDSNLREILNAIFYLNKTGCLGCSISPLNATNRSCSFADGLQGPAAACEHRRAEGFIQPLLDIEAPHRFHRLANERGR
jgi:hypothetical protein